MKLTTLAAAAAAAVLPMSFAAATAHAEEGVQWYGEAGYTRGNFDDADLNIVHGRIGADITPHFGLEAEAATSLGDDSQTIGGVNVDVKMNYSVGAFVVGRIPAGEGDLFARVGVVNAELEAKALGVTASDSDTGYAVGAGYRWFPNGGQNGLRVEYTRYEYDNEGANAFSIGYVRKF